MRFHQSALALLLLCFDTQRIVFADPSLRAPIKGQAAKKNEDDQRRLKRDTKKSSKSDRSAEDVFEVDSGNITLDSFGFDCSSVGEKKECVDGCVWVDSHCVEDPPSCPSFVQKRSCEKNKFVDGCEWIEETCVDPSEPSSVPSTIPNAGPSMSPNSIIFPTELGPGLSPICIRRRHSLPAPTPQPLSFPRGPRGMPPVKLDTAEPTPVPLVPTSAPSEIPSPKPTTPPADEPTSIPTKSPTNPPIDIEISTSLPTDADVTFRPGDLRKDLKRFGVRICKGMSGRMIARANTRVKLADRQRSKIPFHASPDGAATFSLSNGYVYVSNSEMSSARGGVYGLYFDAQGNVVDYKMLLSGTTRNCSGGKTPFNTYVSCEEYAAGQCWQIDPEDRVSPEVTVLGGEGGNYEAVACDDRNPLQPIFYLTEDHEFGALRKFIPVEGPTGWDMLHGPGTMEYLVFLDDRKFSWCTSEDLARYSQSMYFPNVEGIDYKDGNLFFVSKKTKLLYVLNLDDETYTTSPTNGGLLGDGKFKHSPDQLIRNQGEYLYFTEDGGKTPGVYAVDSSGQRFAIFEAYDSQYFGDETTGLAFSPDGTKMYVCFQDCGCKVTGEIDCGCLFEFWRDDGRSFDGETMSLKYHSKE